MTTTTASGSSAAPGVTGETKKSWPEKPRPSGARYAALVVVALVASAVFWLTSTAEWTIGEGTVTIGEDEVSLLPVWPLFGAVLMIGGLALCWRVRASSTSAAGLTGFLIVSQWAGKAVDFDLLDIYRRWENVQLLLTRFDFFQPDWQHLWRVRHLWLDTIYMAIVATLIGCLIGLVLALLASPVSSPNKVVSQTVKAINSVIRSIPDVGWALLFVAFIGGTTHGLGILAGILALTMFNIGVVAKLVGESIDGVNLGPIEAADASGANLLQRNRMAVLPQVMPSYVSYSLYVFELNIRASAAIGIVGVAGIGQQIMLQFSDFRFDRVSAILAALIVVVLLVDLFSMWARRKLI